MRTSGATSVGLEPRARHRRHSDVKLVRAACPKNTTFLRSKTKKRPCVTWTRYRGVGSGGSSTPGLASRAQTALGQKKPPRRPAGRSLMQHHNHCTVC